MKMYLHRRGRKFPKSLTEVRIVPALRLREKDYGHAALFHSGSVVVAVAYGFSPEQAERRVQRKVRKNVTD